MLLITSCSQPKSPFAETNNIVNLKKGTKTLIILNAKEESLTLIDLETIESDKISSRTFQLQKECLGANHLTHKDRTLFITCSTSNEIHLYNINQNIQISRIIAFEPGANPWALQLLDGEFDSLAITSSFLTHKISMIQTTQSRIENRFVKELELKNILDSYDIDFPYPQNFIQDEGQIYVTLANLSPGDRGWPVPLKNGAIAQISLQDFTLTDLIQTQGTNTTGIIKRDNQAYIINSGTLGNPLETNGSLDILDLRSHQILQHIPLNASPMDAVIDQEGRFIYLADAMTSQILIFDTHENEVKNSIFLPTDPESRFQYISSMAIDNHHLFATEFNSNSLYILSQIDQNTTPRMKKIKVGDGPDSMIIIKN